MSLQQGNTSHLQSQITDYWNGRSQSYDASPGHGLRSQEEKTIWMEILSQLLPPDPLDILDVGTGTGFLALLLSELGHRVTGVDLAQDMLQIARSKRADQAKPIFQPGDAADPPFPPESFDAIVNRHLIWTLVDPHQAFRNWHRLLRSEGRVIGIDSLNPSNRPSQTQLTYSPELISALPLRHPGRPDPVLDAFRQAGFTQVSAQRFQSLEEFSQRLEPELSGIDRHIFIAVKEEVTERQR